MKENRKIILVANSDHTFDINSYLSEQDIIVRFNIPKISTLLPTGQRTDLLFLANTVDVAQKKLKHDSTFVKFINTIENHFSIIFPYSDDLIKIIRPFYKRKVFAFIKKSANNFNNVEYINFLSTLGHEVTIMPDHYYLNLKNQVDPDTHNILSTGLLAMHYFLNNPTYQDYDLYLHGFSFEGWDGHAWDKEKQYIESLFKENKIYLFTNSTPDQ